MGGFFLGRKKGGKGGGGGMGMVGMVGMEMGMGERGWELGGGLERLEGRWEMSSTCRLK